MVKTLLNEVKEYKKDTILSPYMYQLRLYLKYLFRF